MHTQLVVLILVFVLLCADVLAGGGSRQSPPGNIGTTQADPQFDPGRQQQESPESARLRRQQEQALNKSRHAALKKDTDKLLELATELKTYVDKSNEHTLSMDVVRQAEAIEKLARSVKEKMKGM